MPCAILGGIMAALSRWSDFRGWNPFLEAIWHRAVRAG
jgi:hypothetical protein